MKKEIEICTYSIDSCRVAEQEGVERVELCSAPSEGGLTPSAAMITYARKVLKNTKLYVMIRPRGGDFLYNDDEFEVMKYDIEFARKLGADGVVFGLLNANGTINTHRTKELVEIANPMGVTFHRAFDMSNNLVISLEDIIETGCERVLTSGGKSTAIEGVNEIEKLVIRANGRIAIMAGSGVNGENVTDLLKCGVDAIHLTAKNFRDSQMIYRNPNISMGATPLSEYDIMFADVNRIKEIIIYI